MWQLWIALFTAVPEVGTPAATYLTIAALGYAFIGMNTLTQAFQAMGQTFWPLVGVASRAVILAAGGWFVVRDPNTGVSGLAIVTALGLATAGGIATLCFDAQTGLLVRMLRYGPSPVGRIVTRVDYDDYREAGNSGVKIPFKWTMSWLDGRNVYTLKTVRERADGSS